MNRNEYTLMEEIYRNLVEYTERMTTPECKEFYKLSDEYLKGYKNGIFRLFQEIRNVCASQIGFPEISRDKILISAFKSHIDDNNNEYPVIGVLQYRGENIPVYLDDYGQQEFIIYHGTEISGGSFNLAPEENFCYSIDKIKDNIS